MSEVEQSKYRERTVFDIYRITQSLAASSDKTDQRLINLYRAKETSEQDDSKQSESCHNKNNFSSDSGEVPE